MDISEKISEQYQSYTNVYTYRSSACIRAGPREKKSLFSSLKQTTLFLFQYLTLTGGIFLLLMGVINYSAYSQRIAIGSILERTHKCTRWSQWPPLKSHFCHSTCIRRSKQWSPWRSRNCKRKKYLKQNLLSSMVEIMVLNDSSQMQEHKILSVRISHLLLTKTVSWYQNLGKMSHSSMWWSIMAPISKRCMKFLWKNFVKESFATLVQLSRKSW